MLRSSDYMLTAEELRLKRRRRRRVIAIVLVLLIVLVLGIFLARPTRDAIKSWQARRHASKAFALIEAGKWNEARSEAVAGYQLRPTEPEALRALARFLSRMQQQQALDFWNKLREVATLTREDLREEATIAIGLGETERATTAMDELFRGSGKEIVPHDWLLAAELALRKSDPKQAQANVQKFFESSPPNERERLQATLLQLRVANAEDAETAQQHRSEAWSRIAELARGNGDVALDALLLLAQRALSGGARTDATADSDAAPPGSWSASALAQALENHPLAKAPQKLVALDLKMHQEPAQKEECIARAITEWKDADVPSLAALARWLNGHGEFQRELDTIPLEAALRAPDLFMQHVDALGALGRWEEIKQLLEAERFPLDPVVQHMYLARCNAQLGEKTAAENSWQRALEAAHANVGKLMTLANYAEKNGIGAIAENAYAAAATESPKFRPAQEGRLRIAQYSRDTQKIHSVLAEMLTIWPNDTAVQNDEAYTRLLLMPTKVGAAAPSPRVEGDASANGAVASSPRMNATPRDSAERDASHVDPNEFASTIEAIDTAAAEQVERLAEQLVHREPASLAHRTLLALARLRGGHVSTALDAYGIEVPEKVVTSAAIAIRSAALAANGRMEEAQTLIKDIRVTQLLPEERALIQDLL